MALTLIAYGPAHAEQPVTIDDLAAALANQDGLEFDADDGADYRPWRWHDPECGARCVGDLGVSPLVNDPVHPDRDYDGWTPAGLVVHIPLAGPHWIADASLRMVARLSAAIPSLAWLDTEDTKRSEDDEGPTALDPERVMASWTEQRAAVAEGRNDPQMPREQSERLYGYRRAVGPARREHPELRWPGAMVLADGDQARPTCIWLDCEQDIALPPVDLVVIRRSERDTGVIPADELRTAAGATTPLLDGLATLITMNDATRSLFENSELWPIDRFEALDDVEWSD